MTVDLLNLVVKSVPVELHRYFKTHANEGALNLGLTAKKHNYTRQQSGMAWYAEAEHALRAAAISAKMVGEQNMTVPPGGSFTTITAGEILIGRYSARMRMAVPQRNTRYLRRLTAANAAIDTQGSLFATQAHDQQPYASYLTVLNYKTWTCSHIGFGFLAPCRSRWIDYWSIEEMMAAYTPTESIDDKTGSEIPDHVEVHLKKK